MGFPTLRLFYKLHCLLYVTEDFARHRNMYDTGDRDCRHGFPTYRRMDGPAPSMYPRMMPLLWVIRDVLKLKGDYSSAIAGIGLSWRMQCASEWAKPCEAARSPVSVASKAPITTLEGLADGTHPVQLAWLEIDVPQCGYCQLARVMLAAALLGRDTQARPIKTLVQP